jgi:hypothetical protein
MDALKRTYIDVRLLSTYYNSDDQVLPTAPLSTNALIIATRQGSPRPLCKELLDRISLLKAASIRDVVQTAIGYLVVAEPKSLLARGFIRRNDAAPWRGDGTAWGDLTVVALNASVDRLYSQPWREALRRMGAIPLLNILCDVRYAIFESLENGCWLQLTGIPMSETVWEERSYTPTPTIQPTVKISTPKPHPLDVPMSASLPVSHCLFSQSFARGGPGLPRSHILSLLSSLSSTDEENTQIINAKRLMHHIFIKASHLALLRVEATPPTRSLLGTDALAAATHRRTLLMAATGRIINTANTTQQRGRPLLRRAVSVAPSGIASKGNKMTASSGGLLRRTVSEDTPRPYRFLSSAAQAERVSNLPASIPRALTTIIPLFLQVLQRAKRLSWSRLLNRFCPVHVLPSTTSSASGSGVKRARDGTIIDTAAAAAANTNTGTDATGGLPMFELITPFPQVVAWVGALVRALTPLPLLGGAHNSRVIMRAVAMMLRCAGAGERASPRVADALASLRTHEFGALRGTGDAASQTRFARAWVLWLLVSVALPAVRAHFYASPADAGTGVAGGARALFYRKPVWTSALSRAWPALKQRLDLKPYSAAAIPTRDSLGFATVRFVPKAKGLRPVMNLAVVHRAWPRPPLDTTLSQNRKRGRDETISSVIGAGAGAGAGAGIKQTLTRRIPTKSSTSSMPPPPPSKSINKELSLLHHILRFERRRTPAVVGGGVFSLDGAHAALRAFARVRAESGLPRGGPLSIFTADAHAAYDSLSQDGVLAVAAPVLKADNAYVIRSHTVIRASGPGGAIQQFNHHQSDARGVSDITSAALRAHIGVAPSRIAAPSNVRARREYEAFPEDSVPRFPDLATNMARRMRNAIFCDSVVGWGARGVDARLVQKTAAIRQLETHVRGHLVATPDGLTVQTRGLPQGSVLSSALCNIAFGGVEAAVFLPRARASLSTCDTRGSALVMRLTDDWLVAAEDGRVALALADALHAGAPSWGVGINAAKTVTSFSFDVGGTGGLAAPQSSLRWAQLRFSAATGEPTASHHSYTSTGGMAAAVPGAPGVCSAHPAATLAAALRASLRPKCHAVLLDSAIVSANTAALNIYEICIIAGAKMLVLLRRARGSSAVGPLGMRMPTVVAIILDAIGYLDVLIRLRCPAPRFGERTTPSVATAAAAAAVAVAASVVEIPSACRLVLGPALITNLKSDSPPEINATSIDSARRTAALPLSTGEVLWLALTAFARMFSRCEGSLPGVTHALLAVRTQLCHSNTSNIQHRLRIRASVVDLGDNATQLLQKLVLGERGRQK